MVYVQSNMVSYNGDAYVIGITDASEGRILVIYKLSCPQEKCQWTRIKQEKIQGRSNFVAFPVTDSFAHCT